MLVVNETSVHTSPVTGRTRWTQSSAISRQPHPPPNPQGSMTWQGPQGTGLASFTACTAIQTTQPQPSYRHAETQKSLAISSSSGKQPDGQPPPARKRSQYSTCSPLSLSRAFLRGFSLPPLDPGQDPRVSCHPLRVHSDPGYLRVSIVAISIVVSICVVISLQSP